MVPSVIDLAPKSVTAMLQFIVRTLDCSVVWGQMLPTFRKRPARLRLGHHSEAPSKYRNS